MVRILALHYGSALRTSVKSAAARLVIPAPPVLHRLSPISAPMAQLFSDTLRILVATFSIEVQHSYISCHQNAHPNRRISCTISL